MPDREKVVAQCEWAIKQTSPTIIESKTFYEEVLALLKDYDTQLQYRDDHIAEYEKEIKRLEDLLKAREEIIKQYHKTDTFLAIHGWKWEGR